MCGICGFVGIHEDGLLEAMTATLTHRGPDSEGFLRDGDAGLGFRRLSIIDVAGGDQPIANEDGSLVIVFNGEIYNYQELRRGLLERGHVFRTRSDTEVILHLYEERGPDCLHQLNGMWGLAIWDRTRRRLFLARDRLGVKPLYYAQLGNRFLFASESKAILRYRRFSPTLDLNGVHQYLRLRYAPGPGGLLREIRKLPAGHYATLEEGRLTVSRYWEPEVYRGPYGHSDREYLEGFAEHFERSVRMRLISEVPVGAYLSGGVDSGTIVAVMSRFLSQPVRTFTVGFDYQLDELAEAAETARSLGCRHTEVACRPQDVELLPSITWHMDEPLGDPIVLPMFLLAREARRTVTVILTGEGADETLGGYLFLRGLLTAHRVSRVPRWLRRVTLEPGLALTPSAVLNLAFDYPATLGTRGKRKIQDFLNLIDEPHLPGAFRHLMSLFDSRDTRRLYSDAFRSGLSDAVDADLQHRAERSRGAPFLNRAIDLQFADWLPDAILLKQDKLAMASGIEARVPFLDYRLVEYLLRVPPHLKLRRGVTKVLLRQYAAAHLPAHAASRRKVPFYVPLERFLADPAFHELVADTLSDDAVRARGLFRVDAVAALKRSLAGGEFMFLKQVFSLVMLELWFRMAIDRRGEKP